MKTIFINLLVLVGVVTTAFLSFGWKDAAAETAPALVTNSKLNFSSPTLAATSTTQAVSQAVKVIIVPARATQSPATVEPTTVSYSAIATSDAIELESRTKSAEVSRIEWEVFIYGITETAKALAFAAWEFVKIIGTIALIIVALIAIGTAYIRSMRGDFKKTAQNGAQANTQPTQPDLPEARLMKAGYANKTVLGFCRRLEELEGIYTASMESKFYPEPLPDQASLRELVRLMKSFDLLTRIDGGWELSVEGWNMLGRLTP